MSTGGLILCRPQPLPFGDREQGFRLISDPHIGAANVDYALIKEELEEAKENKDRISFNGDIFDFILVKDHKRFTPDVLHPRLQGKRDIVNGAIEWAVELFGPYADLIDMIGVGNHDVTLEKWSSTDAVKILVYELQRKVKTKGHVIHYGGYGGFLDYRLRWPNNGKRDRPHGARFVIYYHHGSGGSAPVTKGMIDMARKSWAECDLIWQGHKHVRWNATILSVACPLQGDDPEIREIRQIFTGAYFQTYKGQTQESVREHGRRSNYAADWGCAPQGNGGARVVLTPYCTNQKGYGYTVKVIQ